SPFLHSWHDVLVGVLRQPRRAVPKPFADDLRILSGEQQGAHNLSRLAGCHGLTHRADRGGFGDAGDEAVALVVAAVEPALVFALTHEKEQLPVGGRHVEDSDPGLGPWLPDDVAGPLPPPVPVA